MLFQLATCIAVLHSTSLMDSIATQALSGKHALQHHIWLLLYRYPRRASQCLLGMLTREWVFVRALWMQTLVPSQPSFWKFCYFLERHSECRRVVARIIWRYPKRASKVRERASSGKYSKRKRLLNSDNSDDTSLSTFEVQKSVALWNKSANPYFSEQTGFVFSLFALALRQDPESGQFTRTSVGLLQMPLGFACRLYISLHNVSIVRLVRI